MRWLLPLLILTTGCFPSLPDDKLVDNLRVLAINVDPAVARLDQFPPPEVTVTALTVHPDDEELADAQHTWTWELGDDVDREVFDALLPEGPHGAAITLDLAALLEQRGGEIEFINGALPLKYVVEYDGDHRNTIKLVHFLIPSFAAPDGERDELGPSLPNDDDDDGPPPPPSPLPEVEVNLNPEIVKIEVGGQAEFSVEAEDLPGTSAPVYGGEVDEDGLTITVTVADDQDVGDLRVRLMRTSGCPSLKLELPFGPGGQAPPSDPEDPCGDSETFGGGGGGGGPFGEEDATPETREFDWRPYPGESSEGTRLWVVVRDGDGAQTWQEIRPEPGP